MAKVLDRQTYGDQVQVQHAGTVALTAGMVRERLTGDITDDPGASSGAE
jgi:hypothetical protein